MMGMMGKFQIWYYVSFEYDVQSYYNESLPFGLYYWFDLNGNEKNVI